MTTELTLLSRVSYRDQEIAGPRMRGLLALLAADLRTGCSTAGLVEGLWPDGQPENPVKALQVLVSRARAQLGSGVVASTPAGYRLSADAARHLLGDGDVPRVLEHLVDQSLLKVTDIGSAPASGCWRPCGSSARPIARRPRIQRDRGLDARHHSDRDARLPVAEL